MSLHSVPTPPDITATAVNSTHALLTWNYPQNVVRECDAVYRRVEVGQQDGVIQTTDLQTPVPTGPEMVSGREKTASFCSQLIHTIPHCLYSFTESDSPI